MWFVEVLEIADAEGKPTGEFRLTARSNEGGGGPHAFVNHRHGSRSMASACPECRAYIERVTGMSLVQMSESPRKNFKVGQKWYTRRGGIASIVSVLPASHDFPIVAVHEGGEQRTHRIDGKNTFDGNGSDLVDLFEGVDEADDVIEARLRKVKCQASLKEAEPVVPGYEPLAGVLREALNQAQAGKGKERHANGKAFLDQPIMSIGRMVGIGYQTGQAMKKSQEAVGMHNRGELDRAVAEMLGAINYLAAAILAIREKPHE